MISYKYLSKALKCHVNVAKQMLFNFVQQQQEKGNKDLGKDFRIKDRIRRGGFLRIFTVYFLLFLAPVEGSNPAGPIF